MSFNPVNKSTVRKTSISKANIKKKTSTKKVYKKKPVVKLVYACYICDDVLSRGTITIDHARRLHQVELPKRRTGHRRPADKDFTYQKISTEPYDEQRLACPCCWFHCPEKSPKLLTKHVQETHDPINIDEDDYDELESQVDVDEDNTMQVTEYETDLSDEEDTKEEVSDEAATNDNNEVHEKEEHSTTNGKKNTTNKVLREISIALGELTKKFNKSLIINNNKAEDEKE